MSAESKPIDSYLMWRNLWLLWLLLILIVSSYPCAEFHTHGHWDKVSWVPFRGVWGSVNLSVDAVKNLILYMPFGFFYGQSQSHLTKSAVFKVALLTALLSTGCEFFQIFCHGRHPTMTDVSTNVMGGVLGVVIALRYRSGKR